MKRTKIIPDIKNIPHRFHPLIEGSEVYGSSCSPEARVIFVDKCGGYYLKCAPKGSLEREAKLAKYFHSGGLGANVADYFSDEKDWLLTERVKGEDCTHADYLADPERLCDTIALKLCQLHEMDFRISPSIIPQLNLGTDKYRSRFFDAYGRDKIDEDMLWVIAAAEVF